jgi:hypothetical protein
MVFRMTLLIAMAGLAGCAGNEASDQAYPPKANAAWRKSLGDATFVTLAAGESREFKITPDSQTFGFPEGISYFVGLELARSDASQTLTLRTEVVYPFRPRETHVFVPRVAIVAADGRVSRYVGLDLQPSPRRVFAQPFARNNGWQGSLTLAPGESRLAVYTATLLPQTLRLPQDENPGGYWYVPSGPTGVVVITLEAK